MRILSRLATALTALSLSVIMISFMACKGNDPDPVDPEPTVKEKRTEILLAGGSSWAPSASGIKVDGVDVTEDLFDGFSIKFTSASQFTTTGTTPVWERSDTWSFKDDNATAIIRQSDGKEITISSISDTELKLTLEWDEYTYEEGGRKKSIPGTYEFVLTK